MRLTLNKNGLPFFDGSARFMTVRLYVCLEPHADELLSGGGVRYCSFLFRVPL